MKKYFAIIAIFLSGFSVKAQVLNVPLVMQEQNEWCWAGCSKCVLNYYGYAVDQCDIAEYAREVITWYSFGDTNCCVSANYGCNYWNYNWGYPGSIQDILIHFDSINNIGVGVFTPAQIIAEIDSNHLFVEHWSWTIGGGHFVVGYGINGTDTNASIYYMNPWPGEGLSIGSYTWMETGVNDMGDHIWDATNQIISVPVQTSVTQVSPSPNNEVIYPNPSTGSVSIKCEINSQINIINMTGSIVYNTISGNSTGQIDLGRLPKGLYIVQIKSTVANTFSKLVLQ